MWRCRERCRIGAPRPVRAARIGVHRRSCRRQSPRPPSSSPRSGSGSPLCTPPSNPTSIPSPPSTTPRSASGLRARGRLRRGRRHLGDGPGRGGRDPRRRRPLGLRRRAGSTSSASATPDRPRLGGHRVRVADRGRRGRGIARRARRGRGRRSRRRGRSTGRSTCSRSSSRTSTRRCVRARSRRASASSSPPGPPSAATPWPRCSPSPSGRACWRTPTSSSLTARSGEKPKHATKVLARALADADAAAREAADAAVAEAQARTDAERAAPRPGRDGGAHGRDDRAGHPRRAGQAGPQARRRRRRARRRPRRAAPERGGGALAGRPRPTSRTARGSRASPTACSTPRPGPAARPPTRPSRPR